MSCGWRGGVFEGGCERGGWCRGLSGELDIIVVCVWCDVVVCGGGGGGWGGVSWGYWWVVSGGGLFFGRSG